MLLSNSVSVTRNTPWVFCAVSFEYNDTALLNTIGKPMSSIASASRYGMVFSM